MTLAFAAPGITVYLGDCLDILPTLPAGSVHAVITDAPYGLEFMGREWDSPWRARNGFRRSRSMDDAGRDSTFGRLSRTSPEYAAGIGYQQWCAEWAAACMRVLRPGGHLVTFAGPRTSHRLACGIEDAGLEIRDTIDWIYAQGFPKSVNVSKAITKAFGGTPEAAQAAREWHGWGTAVKPAGR
jgi:DNA modification methylase